MKHSKKGNRRYRWSKWYLRLLPFLVDLFAVREGRVSLWRLWMMSDLADAAERNLQEHDGKRDF